MTINTKYELAETFGGRHPSAGCYAVAARYCLNCVGGWIEKHRPGGPIAHIFEAGDTGQAAFQAALAPSYIGTSVTIQPKIDPHTSQRTRPFEVADLAAGACRRWFDRAFPDGGGPSMPEGSPEASFLALTERVKPRLIIYDHDNLLHDVLHLFKIKKRSHPLRGRADAPGERGQD